MARWLNLVLFQVYTLYILGVSLITHENKKTGRVHLSRYKYIIHLSLSKNLKFGRYIGLFGKWIMNETSLIIL